MSPYLEHLDEGGHKCLFTLHQRILFCSGGLILRDNYRPGECNQDGERYGNKTADKTGNKTEAVNPLMNKGDKSRCKRELSSRKTPPITRSPGRRFNSMMR